MSCCLNCFPFCNKKYPESDKKNNIINKKEGSTIKWEDTNEFFFPIQEGIVIKVYDGDTFTIASKMPIINSPLYRFPVRLRGIDAPEMKTHNEDEKVMAREARDALARMILHKKVTLKNVGNEKYGRILADVYLDNLYINEWLLREHYAVPYDGGTKNPPESWLEYRHMDK
jgi:endonuclease YncB( thermonuclease family)